MCLCVCVFCLQDVSGVWCREDVGGHHPATLSSGLQWLVSRINLGPSKDDLPCIPATLGDCSNRQGELTARSSKGLRDKQGMVLTNSGSPTMISSHYSTQDSQ